MKKEWTLRQLAAGTGVPERTIRFYISRGLVDPPLRGGRGAAYGAGHKARLEAIKKLQAKGMMLAEISHAIALANSEPVFHAELRTAPQDVEFDLAKRMKSRAIREGVPPRWRTNAQAPAYAPIPASALPEPAVWRSYQVAADVTVLVRAESGPWRTKRILSALREFSALIAPENADRETGEPGERNTSEASDEQEKSNKGIQNDKDDKENQGE